MSVPKKERAPRPEREAPLPSQLHPAPSSLSEAIAPDVVVPCSPRPWFAVARSDANTVRATTKSVKGAVEKTRRVGARPVESGAGRWRATKCSEDLRRRCPRARHFLNRRKQGHAA